MTVQPFYAVRITVHHQDGSTATRDYVRGQQHLGRDAFAAFALGDLLLMVNPTGAPVSWQITEVDFLQVQENRKYHHTTHA